MHAIEPPTHAAYVTDYIVAHAHSCSYSTNPSLLPKWTPSRYKPDYMILYHVFQPIQTKHEKVLQHRQIFPDVMKHFNNTAYIYVIHT